MASTRSTTGNSKPRLHTAVSTTPERKRKTTTTTTTSKRNSGGTTTKRNSGGGGRVTKKSSSSRAPNAHHKRKSHLGDKIEGAAEKAVGAITRKPGKKAAGTKKMRGTDGKNSRTQPRRRV